MSTFSSPPTKFSLSSFGTVHWIGFKTLYLKEVRRFINVWTQTLLAPVISTLLFLAIFILALGHNEQIDQVTYIEFLAPGLIMMAMMQNAFVNTSSSILLAKIQGNIVDLLMPPLRPIELTLALALGGLTRGIMVGFFVGCSIAFVSPLSFAHIFYVVFYSIMACLMLSLLGIISGILSYKFDHLSAITNFVITPLSFLSGTFYSTSKLPEFWQKLAHFDPFFYMIDGFRFGFIGHADSSLHIGIIMIALGNLILIICVHRLFVKGYRLKN